MATDVRDTIATSNSGLSLANILQGVIGKTDSVKGTVSTSDTTSSAPWAIEASQDAAGIARDKATNTGAYDNLVQNIFRKSAENFAPTLAEGFGSSGAYNSTSLQMLQDNARGVAVGESAGAIIQGQQNALQTLGQITTAQMQNNKTDTAVKSEDTTTTSHADLGNFLKNVLAPTLGVSALSSLLGGLLGGNAMSSGLSGLLNSAGGGISSAFKSIFGGGSSGSSGGTGSSGDGSETFSVTDAAGAAGGVANASGSFDLSSLVSGGAGTAAGIFGDSAPSVFSSPDLWAASQLPGSSLTTALNSIGSDGGIESLGSGTAMNIGSDSASLSGVGGDWSTIGGVPWVGPALNLAEGNVAGAAGSAALGYLGNLIMPGVGGVVGSIVGSLIGGSHKEDPHNNPDSNYVVGKLQGGVGQLASGRFGKYVMGQTSGQGRWADFTPYNATDAAPINIAANQLFQQAKQIAANKGLNVDLNAVSVEGERFTGPEDMLRQYQTALNKAIDGAANPPAPTAAATPSAGTTTLPDGTSLNQADIDQLMNSFNFSF